jgi:ABC-type polysaccharide/polyol phosphate export permease
VPAASEGGGRRRRLNVRGGPQYPQSAHGPNQPPAPAEAPARSVTTGLPAAAPLVQSLSRYGGAVWTLCRTDLKVRYHGSVGGFLWALLKPASMFLVLMTVFSVIFAQHPDYRFNLIIGLFLWDYFAEATKVGMVSLAAKGYVLTKSDFPRWILVATSSANPLVTLFAFSLVLFASLAWTGRLPGPALVALYVLYLLHLFLITLGFALGTSVLFLRYRDLNQVWDVVSQAGFFVAPIIYPIDIIPERYHFFLYLWPPTPIIQNVRSVLIQGEIPSLRAHLLLTGMTAVIVAAGVALYRRFGPTAAEHL